MPEPRVFRQHRYQPPAGATELLLVRHGESEAVVEGRPVQMLDGYDDPPLAPEGRVQAERVGVRLAAEQIDAIYVTPLRRTAETAAPLAARLRLTPVVAAGLREVYLGEWENGVFRQKMADGDPIGIQMLREQRWDVIPGAEAADVFAARVRGEILAIAARHPDQRVVVVAHGGTIGEILRQATNADPFAFVGADNGSISHLVITDGRWHLRRFNDSTHLAP